MDATRSSETLIPYHNTKVRHKPEDLDFTAVKTPNFAECGNGDRLDDAW
jgi:hypothetical protein